MPRTAALFASLAPLAIATTLFLSGCGSINTAPLPSSTVRLTPNPPHIYVAPFDTSTAKWLVGREGIDLYDFKKDFQTNFQQQLQNRLMKIAPTEQRWVDDLALSGTELNSITQPVLLVHGRDDQVVPWRASSGVMADLLPDCRLHLIGACGHWTMIERAAEFLGVVRPFLAGA